MSFDVDTHQIDMVVPSRANKPWQQQEDHGTGFSDFQIDWDAQQATRPQDRTSASWVLGHDIRGYPRDDIMFNASERHVLPGSWLSMG